MNFPNIVIGAAEALDNARAAGKMRAYPKDGDDRVEDTLIIPSVQPRFSIRPGETVFTIGSVSRARSKNILMASRCPRKGFSVVPNWSMGARTAF